MLRQKNSNCYKTAIFTLHTNTHTNALCFSPGLPVIVMCNITKIIVIVNTTDVLLHTKK